MKLSDLFTYQADESSKRRLRFYVKASIFILILLTVLWVVSFNQQSRQQQVMAETKPIDLPILTPPVPTSTHAPTATVEPCPTDPKDWNMTEIAPGDVFLHIEPACVYEGLERTVAFTLGITEGYSRQAVADELGFEKLPMVRLKQVTIANPNGPLPMDVGFAIDIPDFAEWYFNDKLRPSTSMALQGCFRTYTIAGNEKQAWDENGYPVVCRVSSDNESKGATICFGDLCYTDTSPIPTKRGFALFGYAGNGRWDWLGTEKDTFIELDPQAMINDRSTSAQLQGVGPWDASWLKQAYGLDMRPLPENWKSFEGKKNLQRVLDALNAFSAGGTSP